MNWVTKNLFVLAGVYFLFISTRSMECCLDEFDNTGIWPSCREIALRNRKKLSPDEQKFLDIDLGEKLWFSSDAECIRAILERGANPNCSIETVGGVTMPLVKAIQKGEDFVAWLLVYGADPKVGRLAAIKKRGDLSSDERVKIDLELQNTLRELSTKGSFAAYKRILAFLMSGADPNYIRCLKFAARIGWQFADLLLAYGADPHSDEEGAPISRAADCATVQLLVRAGMNINGNGKKSLLWWLCARRRFSAVVWALSHGADPNIRKAPDVGVYAIHAALHNYDLRYVVALLQHGARLDLKVDADNFYRGLDVLQCAYQNLRKSEPEDCALFQDESRHSYAQYELLKAVVERKLNPCHVYTLDEYEILGISHESAELIRQETQAVNDAFAQCARDDFFYDHSGECIANFVLDRELGRRRKIGGMLGR